MRLAARLKQRVYLCLRKIYYCFVGKPHFDTLPPEMAEIPIKMAINTAMSEMGISRKHNYLVDVIAEVFPKFKYLAARKSLWQGEVLIEGDEEKVKKVVNEFLNDGTTNLELYSKYLYSINGTSECKITGDDILAIADKCHKLEFLALHYFKMESWPIFTTPWTSLTHLRLYFSTFPLDLLCDVKLHLGLPNLRIVHISILDKVSHFNLPDMEDCKKLTWVGIGGGKMSINRFPPQLRTFIGHGTITNMSKASFQAKHRQCNFISDTILFET